MSGTYNREVYQFVPEEIIYNLIKDNITDYNTDRSALPTPAEREWIFPEFREDYTVYPQVVIELGDEDVVKGNAGDCFDVETDGGGNVTSDVYEELISVICNVYIYTKKETSYNVTFPDESTGNVSNKAFNQFLGTQIKNLINENRNAFVARGVIFDGGIGSTPTLENDSFTYVRQLEIPLLVSNKWFVDRNPDNAIDEINVNETILENG